MSVVVEDLHAEVRQIVECEIDPTLVPVEKADPSVVGDPKVRRAWVAVDDARCASGERGEHVEELAGKFGREGVEVRVDASASWAEFGHRAGAGALLMATTNLVQAAELGGDEPPVRLVGWFASVDPPLHDDAVGAERSLVGLHGDRHQEVVSLEKPEKLELPLE